MTGETAQARLKRMKMRAWRRGTREMDLVFGPWAEVRLAGMTAADLAVFDRLLAENDQDLAAWILGTASPPDWAGAMILELATFAEERRREAATRGY